MATDLDRALVDWLFSSLQDAVDRGEVLNSHLISLRDPDLFYGPPYITVTHTVAVMHEGKVTNPADECVIYELSWDHTYYSLLEAADAARRGGGCVYVSLRVLASDWGVSEGRPGQPARTRVIDEGPSFKVWPEFTGKNLNISEEE